MSAIPEIHGTCDPKFAGVREAFAENFAERREIGASVAVMVDGQIVVDLWGGSADRRGTRPWKRDTLANVYSTTKGITAICAHRLVDKGELDLDAPVAKYWPEFAQAGKGDMPVRYLLGHRAGLPAVSKPLPDEALYSWEAMTGALAEQEPWWKPGESHGYHAITYGWLVGELIRRITGKSVGRYFREEIAGPLSLDFWIGLPASEHERVARMAQAKPSEAPDSGERAGQPNLMRMMMENPTGITARAFANPMSLARPGVVNTPEWRQAELPAANGHATARSLATLYGALAAGGVLGRTRVLSPESIGRCSAEQSRGPDEVLQVSTRFGLGFMLPQEHRSTRFGPNDGAFGHPGAGGSLGYADPEARVGFGYVMNHMGFSLIVDPRPAALIDALYESLS